MKLSKFRNEKITLDKFLNFKIIKKFSEEVFSIDVLEKSFDKLKRSNIKPRNIDTLLIYRDCVKLCKKFYWNNENNGRQWSEILLKSVRKDFENNKNLEDSVEIGKLQVQARQGIIDLQNKLANVSIDINKFITNTRIPNKYK